MRTPSIFIGWFGLLFSTVLIAADPPYAGRWQSVKGASGSMSLEVAVADGYDLVVSQGAGRLKANFDGRDYRPESGPETVRIARVGSDAFSMTVSINGTPVAVDTFTASADGRTLTQVGGAVGQPPNHTIVYERRRCRVTPAAV
jgi:hypothetical protein